MTTTSNNKPKLPSYKVVDGFIIPGFIKEESYRSAIAYKPRDNDLFVVTYPKSGTTWVQNIVSCIYREGRSFNSALEFLLGTPFLEMTGAEGAVKMQRPGAIKVHFPFYLVPWSPKAKYIFVTRNPKDICVSFYHHTKNIVGYNFEDGKFEDYFDLFIEGQVDFGDYFDTLLSWYEHRNDPNVLFITYEQLKQDTRTYVLKIAEFLGSQYKEALQKNEKILDDVIYHSSFKYLEQFLNKYMAEIASLPKDTILNDSDIPQGLKDIYGSDGKIFNKNYRKLRKGIVGDWKNYFTPEQNKRLEEKFYRRTKGTELEELWKNYM